MLKKTVLFTAILIALSIGASAQCNIGSPTFKTVQCCQGINVQSQVCQGTTGGCNPFATLRSCTSTCSLGVAGECFAPSTLKLKSKLENQSTYDTGSNSCSVNRAVFQEWLKRTSTTQLSWMKATIR
jgi:hypothetical protein